MKARTLLPVLAALTLAGITAARADTVTVIDDPLHGECVGCVDNGTNTPLPTSTSVFGFSSSPPGQSGTLTLDVLVPDNVNLATFVIPGVSGFATGTPALFSSTAWTAGTLHDYLGETVTSSPDNGIGAYLPTTQGQPGDGSVTGFFDFRFLVGASGTMTGPGVFPTNNDFQLGDNLPAGSYVIAELLTTDNKGNAEIVNTANSGALLVGTPLAQTPLPASIVFMFTGLLGLIGIGRKWAIPLA